jgi:hypothetical protein
MTAMLAEKGGMRYRLCIMRTLFNRKIGGQQGNIM